MLLAEDLKKAVLQAAIQGKLVEQRPEEGNAEQLYKKIQAKKQELISEGKIKKEKPLPEITEDEIPFEIPESWKWARLRDCVSILGDGLHGTPEYDSKGEYFFINGNNLSDGKIILKQNTKRVSVEEYEKYKKNLNDNTVLVSINGTIGNIAFYNDEMVMLGKSACYFNLIANNMKNYIYWLIKSDYFLNYAIDNATGAVIKNVSLHVMNMFLVPIPPLDEQLRIVRQIERIMQEIDAYSEAEQELATLQQSFPDDFRKSVLQYAMQGKLVEQRLEEGTGEELYLQIQEEKARLIEEGGIKKEKPLTEITDDEIPFDIPDSWKWVRLSQVVDVRDGTHDSPQYVSEGIPLVTSKNLSGGALNFDNIKYITQDDADKINFRSAVDDGDILFAMIGSIGNPVMVKKDREFCIKNVALFKQYPNSLLDMEYVYRFLCYAQFTLKAEAYGGVQSFVSLTRFREYLFPLPPLEEQKRIVRKLEALFPIIDDLSEVI